MLKHHSALTLGPINRWRLRAAARATARALPERLAELDARWPKIQKSSDEPVFVCAAGWRSGSTLLQRMLMHSGTTLMWGEPYNQSCLVQSLADQIRALERAALRDTYFLRSPGRQLTDEWVANLYPDVADLHAAHLAYFETLFASPARAAGWARWGLKEVRFSTQHVAYLRWLYPQARVLYLVRDPVAAYASYKTWLNWFWRWPDNPITGPWQFGRMWRSLAQDYYDAATAGGGLLVRYEDLEARAADIGAYLGDAIPPPSAISQARGSSASRPSIGLLERRLLVTACGAHLLEAFHYRC